MKSYLEKSLHIMSLPACYGSESSCRIPPMVNVGLGFNLTKKCPTRSAIKVMELSREIVYYSDTCIVHLAVREMEYFTEILPNIPCMREQWCPGRFFPPHCLGVYIYKAR